jgi:hypothetical protein
LNQKQMGQDIASISSHVTAFNSCSDGATKRNIGYGIIDT